MNGRARVGSLAASPTMVGAITTLIVIVAVFLAYNANNGLPFVPTYKVSAEICDAARLGAQQRGPDRRKPGRRRRVDRHGPGPAQQRLPERRRLQRLDGRQAQPEARQERRPAARRLHDPGPLPLVVRAQVPRDHPRHQRERACRTGATLPLAQSSPQVEFDDVYNTFDTADPREQPARPAGLRRRVRGPGRLRSTRRSARSTRCSRT